MSKYKILFVDDELNVLAALARAFRSAGYEIETASSGQEALEIAQAGPPDLVVSDHRMPEMTGVELLAEFRQRFPDVVRILLTGYADINAATDAINLGEVYRFISKPWNDEDLKITIRNALQQKQLERQNAELNETVEKQNRQLRQLNTDLEAKVEERTAEVKKLYADLQGQFVHSVKVFIELIGLRNANMSNHSKRVAAYCKAVCRSLGMDQQTMFDIEIAAVLHDIGKIGMPDILIDCSVPTLSPSEEALYEEHPMLGEKVLQPIPELKTAATIVRHHHEQFDGKGFPDHRRRDDIPIGSRLIAIADAFDRAVFSKKFGERMPKELAFELLKRRSVYDFDPELADSFIGQLSSTEKLMAKNAELKIALDELSPGMVTACEIKTHSGILLIPKGQELTEDDLRRLLNHHEVDPIVSGVFVVSDPVNVS